MTDRTDPADPAAREMLDPPPAGSDDRETLDPPATDPDATRDPQSVPSAGSAPTLPVAVGRFEVRDFLGEGSFGTVYRAYDPQLDREVALKVAKPGAASPERFRREAKASANLRHPNIVPLFEAGEIGSHLYFASAFVPGTTLEDALHERGGTFSPQEAAAVTRKLADALAYAHGQGVVHRDVKSANVILDPQSEPHLLDFGLALRNEGRERMTQDGSVLGTPSYLAPEVARGDRGKWGPAADQYSLGVILYELLTGRTPFAGPLEAVLYLHQTKDPERPSKANSAVPRDLEAVCLKCLQKEPGRRYPSAAALADDLGRWLDGRQVSARPMGPAERLARWTRRNRGLAAAIWATFAALVLGAAVSGWFAVEAGRSARAAAAEAENARRERDHATAKEAEMEAVLWFVEDKVFAAITQGRNGGRRLDVALRETLTAGLPQLDAAFADQSLVGARLRFDLGEAFCALGGAGLAEEQFSKAQVVYAERLGPGHPDTLRCENVIANFYAGRGLHAEALRVRKETLEKRRARLGPNHPATLETMVNLADTYAHLDRHAEALKLREEALALQRTKLGHDHPQTLWLMDSLAGTYATLGRHAEALKLREEALALWRTKLGPGHSAPLELMVNLADGYSKFGRHAEALKLQEEALQPFEEALEQRKAALGPDHSDTLATMFELAFCYSRFGRHAEALKLREEVLALRRTKHGPDASDTLMSVWGVANSLIALKRGGEAVPVIDECIRRGRDVNFFMLPKLLEFRLRYFQTADDAAGCRATAETWEGLNRIDANSFYDAACYRAVAAAVGAKQTGADAARLAGEDADRAMACLHKAIAAGYQNIAHLQKDSDLDALRRRPDFADLMWDLADTLPY